MREYLLGVLGIVLIAAIFISIIPEGKTATVIKGTAKMACLLVIISPIIQYFCSNAGNEKNVEKAGMFFEETVIDTDVDFIQYYSEMRVRIAEDSMEKELLENCRVDVEVTLYWEMEQTNSGLYIGEEIKILSIGIKPKNEIEEDKKKEMCEYLENKYCSEVLLE